jgi:hypothetical protein
MIIQKEPFVFSIWVSYQEKNSTRVSPSEYSLCMKRLLVRIRSSSLVFVIFRFTRHCSQTHVHIFAYFSHILKKLYDNE